MSRGGEPGRRLDRVSFVPLYQQVYSLLRERIPGGRAVITGQFSVHASRRMRLIVPEMQQLTARFNAVDLVRKGSEALGGKGGGGRPDMAQAGGPDGAKANAALSAIEKAMAGA